MEGLRDILNVRKDSNKIALKFDKEIVTYKLLYKLACENAEKLNQICGKGNVAIFLPNSIQYVLAYFSIVFADKIIIPIGVISKEAEIRNTIEYCDVDVVITSNQYIDTLRNSLKEIKCKVFIYNIDDRSTEVIGSMYQSNICCINESQSIGNKVALMIHTSGTTSNPKRVMLTNENLISNSKSIIKSLGLKEESRTLIVLPMFLASANTSQLITHLYLGATITIMNGIFLPNRFYKILQEDKITNFTGVPTILGAILDFKPKVNYDISSLEKVCFGGGVVPTSRIVQFEERFPKVKFIQMYGQTEASTRLTHLLYKDSKRKLGSIGKAIPDVQIRIVDNGGTDVSIGQVGEIIAKGPNIMKGYYKREEETKNTLKDGWLFTGDLGRFDEEGYIYITGRKKNIIICGGMNIYPEEIEELIMNLSFVKEVCIVGKEDQAFGEVPVAKIVLYDAKREELKNEIINYCAKNLSSYKIPAEVIFVDELAKTDSGKVKRR